MFAAPWAQPASIDRASASGINLLNSFIVDTSFPFQKSTNCFSFHIKNPFPVRLSGPRPLSFDNVSIAQVKKKGKYFFEKVFQNFKLYITHSFFLFPSAKAGLSEHSLAAKGACAGIIYCKFGKNVLFLRK